MTLKIIGAAPGRTGTVSLMTALEHLGYGPCHHMKACIENASADEMVFRGRQWTASGLA